MSVSEVQQLASMRRAIRVCLDVGLPVVTPQECACALAGQLVVVIRPDGLRLVWPYEEPCPVHRDLVPERPRPGQRRRPARASSLIAARQARTRTKAKKQ